MIFKGAYDRLKDKIFEEDLDDPWGLWEIYGDTADGVLVLGRYEGLASEAMEAAKAAGELSSGEPVYIRNFRGAGMEITVN